MHIWERDSVYIYIYSICTESLSHICIKYIYIKDPFICNKNLNQSMHKRGDEGVKGLRTVQLRKFEG